MYLAKTYIGTKYAPGEIIDTLPQESADWLLKAGAIEVLASAPATEPEEPEEPEEAAEDKPVRKKAERRKAK